MYVEIKLSESILALTHWIKLVRTATERKVLVKSVENNTHGFFILNHLY